MSTTTMIMSQSPRSVQVQQPNTQCDSSDNHHNSSTSSSIQTPAVDETSTTSNSCSTTMSTPAVIDVYSSAGSYLLQQQRQQQQPYQQHRKNGLLRRISATSTSGKLVVPISTTTVSPNSNYKTIPISTRERRYVVSTGMILLFMMTFLSCTSFLGTSHSLQQLVLESRHPLSADHHQRNLIDDATELQRQTQTQHRIEAKQHQLPHRTSQYDKQEDEYSNDIDEVVQHRRISMSSNPFYQMYESTLQSTNSYENDGGRRRRKPISNHEDSAYVTDQNSEEYDYEVKHSDNHVKESNTIEAFHVLSFGAGSTWGEGLPVHQLLHSTTSGSTTTIRGSDIGESSGDSSQSSTTTNSNVIPNQQLLPYPNLLDTNAFNAAMPYHGSSDAALLSAACTETIVGNSNHNHNINVVTIEVTTTSADSASHSILVQRLRLRYPKAIIVLVHIPDPLSQYKLSFKRNASSSQRPSRNSHNITLYEWIHNSNFLELQELLPTNRKMRKLRHSQTSPLQQVKSFLRGWGSNKYSTHHRHLDNDSEFDKVINEIDDDSNARDYEQLAKSMLDDTRGTWYFDDSISQSRSFKNQQLNDIMQNDSNVLLYTFPLFPNATSVEQMTTFFQLFDNVIPFSMQGNTANNKASISTTTVLSSAGHQFVASELRKLISNHRRHHVSSESLSSGSNEQQPMLIGTWGSGDDCHIWYDTGRFDVPFAKNAKQSNLWLSTTTTTITTQSSSSSSNTVSSLLSSLQQLPQNDIGGSWLHKHTLDFTKSGGSGSLTIHNCFSTDRMLYLTYLTDDDHSYPRARVSINGIPSVQLEPFGVGRVGDRLSNNNEYNNNNNAASTNTNTKSKVQTRKLTGTKSTTTTTPIPTPRTSAVGYIPAGTNATIRIDILQKTTTLPFRLIGASLLANEIIDTVSGKNLMDIEFSLEREQ